MARFGRQGRGVGGFRDEVGTRVRERSVGRQDTGRQLAKSTAGIQSAIESAIRSNLQGSSRPRVPRVGGPGGASPEPTRRAVNPSRTPLPGRFSPPGSAGARVFRTGDVANQLVGPPEQRGFGRESFVDPRTGQVSRGIEADRLLELANQLQALLGGSTAQAGFRPETDDVFGANLGGLFGPERTLF
jgi:hypothetical protein